jgi:hypothetical protein
VKDIRLQDEEDNEDFSVDREDGEKMLADVCLKLMNLKMNNDGDGDGEGEDGNGKKKKKKRRKKKQVQAGEEIGMREDDGEILMHEYALTHGVAHLVECNRKDDAKKLLLDVKYLLARSNDGVRLVEDCKLLKGDRTIEVLGSALGLSLSDMRKDPRRIVGQLVGRLMWSAGVGVEEKAKEDEKNETKTATISNGNIKNRVENEIERFKK